MRKSMGDRLRPVETALLLALCVTMLTGVRATGQQRELADKVVRLHVLAESDDPGHQAVKLQVRDALLRQLEPELAEVRNAREAESLLQRMLPGLERTARQVSGGPARVTLGRENYPTRRYADFALPAGEYTSLRVELGAAEGQNWWCVVYPPLCTDSVTEAVRETALTEAEVALITEADGEYELRFRVLELWGELMNRLP